MHSNTARIAKNTLMLYFRQILIMLVSLYTVRVVLEILGAEDYGIYYVVGGVVTFFSFLSGTMASATQRFFSFALGQGDFEKLQKTFSVNLLIYGAIAVIAMVLLGTAGLWFINEQLHVPMAKMESVHWVYLFSVFTFITTILVTPFIAIIIAHEDMKTYAFISIIDAAVKLGTVFVLVYIPWNKLVLYSILVFTVSLVTFGMYVITCIKKYRECQFRKLYWDRRLLYEIAEFTGWTLFGQTTTVIRNQAVTILLNQMFNPVAVAAKSIANQVTSAVSTFSSKFNVGLYPSIVKLYASNEKERMFSLVFRGSKFTFFLMWVFTLPLFLEMDSILKMWLKNPPEEAILFTRLSLVEVLINAVSQPIATAARAFGHMRVYELTLGSIQISIFIVSFFVLMLGAAPYSVFVIAIVANLIMFVVRLLIVKVSNGFPLAKFTYQVVIPMFIVVLTSIIPAFTMHWILPSGFPFVLLFMLTCIVISSASMYFFGIEKREKKIIRNLIVDRMSNWKRR